MGVVRDICEQDGIKPYTTDLYHPASNEVAECTIGVLTNAAHAVLYNSGLRILWAEAFNTVTHVRNRTPTRALDGRTPFEVRYGAKPDLAHLRALGAPCTVVQPLEKLRKLDAQSRMCFFFGYKYERGGYRFGTHAMGRRRVQRSFSMRTACHRPPSTSRTSSPPTQTSWLYSLH